MSRWLAAASVAWALAATSAGAQPSPEAAPADPGLELLRGTVRHATSYVEAYVPALGTLIMHESYVQNVLGGGELLQQRRLTAEFVLVFLPGSRSWLGLRDVVEVDGKVQRDRQARLRKLFPAGRPVPAKRLLDESARFNISSFRRTVNLPTLALGFLEPDVVGGLSFALKGETVLGESRALEILFREEARPTLVRTLDGKDLPAQGTFWIERDTGRVLKTRLWLALERSTAELTVTFQPENSLGLLVPATMRELYVAPGLPPQEVECVATYSGFQRASAETNETYQLPRWGEAAR